jgi:ferrous iron transport protein A
MRFRNFFGHAHDLHAPFHSSPHGHGQHGGHAHRRHGPGCYLADMHADESARILSIHLGDGLPLQQLSNFGLVPGSKIIVHQRLPSWIIMVDETELALDDAIANVIEVEALAAEECR